MAESNSSQISDAAAEWLLAALGNGRLYSAVMAVPALQDSVFRGGFQVAPATLAKPTIRKRLRLTLLGRSDRVVGLLREPGDVPWADAVCLLRALDGDWLKRNWRGLLRASANPALAAAMVADERQAIHRRGLRLLRRTAPWLPTQTARPEALPAELRCAMPPAPADLPAALPASGPATDAGRQHETENLRDALSRQRDKARQNEQELRQARLEWEQREKDLRREIREARAGAEQAAAEVNARVAASAATFRQEVLGITPATARLAEASADAASSQSSAGRTNCMAPTRPSGPASANSRPWPSVWARVWTSP
jgi:Skp family chaperone for outer membrane proteins